MSEKTDLYCITANLGWVRKYYTHDLPMLYTQTTWAWRDRTTGERVIMSTATPFVIEKIEKEGDET